METEKLMIKGCQKKVIWLRNTESELFDEAYFILSENALRSPHTERNMVKEAEKLISSSPMYSYFGGSEDKSTFPPESVYYSAEGSEGKNGKARKTRLRLGKGMCFILGCIMGALPALILLLVG